MSSIADALAPEVLEQLGSEFLAELDQPTYDHVPEFLSEEQAEYQVGMVTTSHLWDAMWRFGIILDDDAARVNRLGNLWRPDGSLETGYYVPDDYDTTYRIIDINNPPTEDVAWDAKSL